MGDLFDGAVFGLIAIIFGPPLFYLLMGTLNTHPGVIAWPLLSLLVYKVGMSYLKEYRAKHRQGRP